MNRAVNVNISTGLTAMEIYPHGGTSFHLFMGIIAVLIFIPVSILIFPFLLAFKTAGYSLLYFAGKLPLLRTGAARPGLLLNRAVIFFHYWVYKIFYIYMTIWWNATPLASFDDYWYGLDVSKFYDYRDYLASFRNSRVRWRFRKKLKTFSEAGIEKEIVRDDAVFFKVLYSWNILKLIVESSFRKNRRYSVLLALYLVLRDYYLLLFLPVRLHVFKKDGKTVGLATYLKRGNTLVMCQHIIASGCTRSCLFYEQMNDLMHYSFTGAGIRYVSCSITTGQAKETCGCYPVNYLLTDEFKYKPFEYL